MTEPEIIDISNLDSGKSINISNSLDDITEINIGGKSSSNFGSGIELLMNDKKKSGGSNGLSSDIDVNDLSNLEDELNDLSGMDGHGPKKSMKSARSDMFSSGFKLNEEVLDDPIVDDTTSIPDRFAPVIIDGATAFVYQYRGETQQYQLNMQRFEQGIKNMQTLLINKFSYLRSTFIPRTGVYNSGSVDIRSV